MFCNGYSSLTALRFLGAPQRARAGRGLPGPRRALRRRRGGRGGTPALRACTRSKSDMQRARDFLRYAASDRLMIDSS